MENNKKRNLIKNILIIFLIVMLLLTFFSNTIMNRSLPEVATQYAQYKQISDKIRGSATVMANQDYSVVWDDEREITEVLVRRGDRVERGQVLYVLSQTEGTDISDKQTELNNLLIQKQQFLLEGSNEELKDYNTDIQDKNLEIAELQEKLEALPEYDKTLDALEAEIEKMQEELEIPKEYLEELNGKMAKYESTYDTAEDILASLNENTKLYNEAKQKYDTAKAEFDANEAEIEKIEAAKEEKQEKIDETQQVKLEYEEKLGLVNSDNATLLALQAAVNEARSALAAIEREYHYFTEMNEAKRALDAATPENEERLLLEYESAVDYYNSLTGGQTRTEAEYIELIDARSLAEENASDAYAAVAGDKKEADKYESKLNSLETTLKRLNMEMSDYDKTLTKLAKSQTKLTEAKNEAESEMNKAEQEKNSDDSRLNYAFLRDEAEEYKDEIKASEKAIAKKEKELAAHMENVPGDEKALREEIKAAQKAVKELERQKENDEKNKPYNEEIRKLQLENIDDSIARVQTEIAKMRGELVETEITSPVKGTITNLAFTAGEKIPAGSEVATISISDKGFTMEFAATNEQCTRMKIGDLVELQNYYYGTKPEITVSAFKNDPANPGRGKIVVLSVLGDNVEVGQTLNFAIGDRSKNYDKVVPNSAIREDSNGKFILVVDAKSTPLGNRYVARRVSVEVITSDETSSALSGELMGGEFIITTSSAPVSDGMQVRLADTE